MRTLAVIPARSGSKGLKDKNILPLCGKPLLSYTIEAALKSQCFDTVMVSTDALEYAEIAAACGAEVPFLRSKAAATDQASSWEVVLEVLQKYEEKGRQFDFVMLLQPTSPLRNEQEIRNAFSVQERNHAEAVVSVCEMEHSPRTTAWIILFLLLPAPVNSWEGTIGSMGPYIWSMLKN